MGWGTRVGEKVKAELQGPRPVAYSLLNMRLVYIRQGHVAAAAAAMQLVLGSGVLDDDDAARPALMHVRGSLSGASVMSVAGTEAAGGGRGLGQCACSGTVQPAAPSMPPLLLVVYAQAHSRTAWARSRRRACPSSRSTLTPAMLRRSGAGARAATSMCATPCMHALLVLASMAARTTRCPLQAARASGPRAAACVCEAGEADVCAYCMIQRTVRSNA